MLGWRRTFQVAAGPIGYSRPVRSKGLDNVVAAPPREVSAFERWVRLSRIRWRYWGILQGEGVDSECAGRSEGH